MLGTRGHEMTRPVIVRRDLAMAAEAGYCEPVSGRNCAGTGYFFGFRGYFEVKSAELIRIFRRLE